MIRRADWRPAPRADRVPSSFAWLTGALLPVRLTIQFTHLTGWPASCAHQQTEAGAPAGVHVNQPYCTMLQKLNSLFFTPCHACEDVVAAGMRCCRVLCAATDRGRVGRCDTLERSGHLAPPHGYCRLVTREPQSRTKCKVSEKLHTYTRVHTSLHACSAPSCVIPK